MGKLLEMPRGPDPLPGLNREQQAAVQHGAGPLLVVAGAGTGKTRVITQRIRYLLESDPSLPGEAILGLTFTDKAAEEMKARVADAAGDRGRMVWLSTFHAFCYQRILQEQNPGLTVLDEYDHWIVLRRNLSRLGLSHFRRTAEPGQYLRDFCEFFARCQDELVTPDDFDGYVGDLEKDLAGDSRMLDEDARRERAGEIARMKEVARAYRVSEDVLREGNLCTFGMQLSGAVQELRRNDALREALQNTYRYILVDEFQDTNIAQIELLKLLSGERRNLVVVGDNDQAIYRFRGASFSGFTIFLKDFTGVTPRPDHLGKHFMPLTQNYRSTQRILRVAGQVIAQNEKPPYLPDKKLHTENAPGDRIQVVEFVTPEEEAHWVANELEKLHEKGRRWDEFGVLYRMHAHRDRLVEELTAREVPFVIKNLSILSNPLIRDLIAYLRVVAYPWDNVACARVLAAPAWGLDPEHLVRLAARTSSRKGIWLWDALVQSPAELPFERVKRNTADLAEMITTLRKLEKKRDAVELLDELTGRLGLVLVREDRRRRYLDCFRQFVREWQQKTTTETRALREFVEYLGYFEEAGGQITLPESQLDDAVQLMTAHAAKGLEFDHVFVLRLSDRAFPAGARRATLEFPERLMKEELPKGDFHIQEERRLFYVALTRARKRLTLTTVVGRRSKQSPFLDDFMQEPLIQAKDIQRLTPKVELPEKKELPVVTAAKSRVAQQGLFDPIEAPSRVDSRIAEWAVRYRPPVFSPLPLSASSIENYLNCPQKYLFDKGWGIRGGAHAAMTFGGVIHTTIGWFLNRVKDKQQPSWDDLEQAYQREWRSQGFEDAYQEEEYRKDGLEQLRAFHEKFTAEPPEVLHVEKPFELAMEREVRLTGRMDAVYGMGDGEVEVVDYKTGRPQSERTAKKNLQLSIYALAAKEVLEVEPARLTLYSLATNEAVWSTREEKDLNEARDKVAETAENIRAGHFPAQPTYNCRGCDYRPICPAFEGTGN